MFKQSPLSWWNREYTYQELMKESRWLLVFIGLATIILGLLRYNSVPPEEAQDIALGMIVLGFLYLVAALARSFWFRFALIAVWVIDLTYTNVFLGNLKPLSFVFITIGLTFIYKMLAYRSIRTGVPKTSDPKA